MVPTQNILGNSVAVTLTMDKVITQTANTATPMVPMTVVRLPVAVLPAVVVPDKLSFTAQSLFNLKQFIRYLIF